MSATARQAQDERGQAERLGIKPGQVVQELGYDTDCDEQLRDAIKAVEGVELVDEDYDEDVVDVPLGLVALNWIRMFLPLLSSALPQAPGNAGPDGLGFAAGTAQGAPLTPRPGTASHYPERARGARPPVRWQT